MSQLVDTFREGKHLLEAHSRANVENPLSIGSMRSRRLFQGEKSMPLPPEQLAINPQLSRITDELQLIERVRKKLNNPRTNLSHPEIRRELVDDVFPKRRTGDGAFDLMNVALLEDKAKSYLTRYQAAAKNMLAKRPSEHGHFGTYKGNELFEQLHMIGRSFNLFVQELGARLS